MRANEATVLVGERVVLVPYRTEHVPTYHAWMESEQLREQTASERLTLEAEHDMQRAWHLDDDKLTFILLALPPGVPRPEGGRPLAQGLPPAPSSGEGEALAQFLAALPMVGDVNLFFSAGDEDEEEGESDPQRSTEPRPAAPAAVHAECEVMIAEPAYRRKGLALEALQLIMGYCDRAGLGLPAGVERVTYVAKVGLGNSASRSLFARLGFREHKVVEVFDEVELRLPGDAPRGVPQAQAHYWPRPPSASASASASASEAASASADAQPLA